MRDYVMLWNAVALEMNRRDHTGRMNAKNNRGPTASSRALAIIHLAMHDAFFRSDRPAADKLGACRSVRRNQPVFECHASCSAAVERRQ